MNPYLGHPSQLSGVERHRIEGGRGDGLEVLEIRNGKGLEMMLCPSRNNDILRLSVNGINIGYFSPCGYAHPAYFDRTGANFLRNFTAGYMTTAGLENVGTPNNDEGEDFGLHGSIGNTPCEQYSYEEDVESITVKSVTSDEFIFNRKLKLYRVLTISKKKNSFNLFDEIVNTNDHDEVVEILYHQNMGYPLVDEDSILKINSSKVLGRNAHATDNLDNWMKMQKPTAGYEECCFYHYFDGPEAKIELSQPKLNLKLVMTYDPKVLPYFTEWKMMGVREYVLGLEPGNCTPDGRNLVRKAGNLVVLKPGDKKQYTYDVSFVTE